MAYSRITYTADGSTTVFAIPFPYLDESHVEVYVDDVQVSSGLLTFPTEGTVDLAGAYSEAELTGLEVLVMRNSSRNDRLVDWTAGSRLRDEDLDLDSIQAFYMAQEALDLGSGLGAASDYSDEQAQDAVGGMLVDTDTIDLNYNDGTPSISASIKNNCITEAMLAFDVATQDELDAAILANSYTDEQAQDAVGNIFSDTATIAWVYDDGAPIIQASIVAGSITTGMLAFDVATQAELDVVSGALAAHLADTGDAHDASAISVVGAGFTNISTAIDDVQEALEALDVAIGGAGVTDHGALTGLADDDHSQYHNDARGDARYWQLTTDLATQVELDAHINDAADAHDASAISVDGSGFTELSAAIDDVQEALDAIDTALGSVGGGGLTLGLAAALTVGQVLH